MKKPIILSIAAVLFFKSLSAQVNFSIAGGGLNYQGEMGSNVSKTYGAFGIDAKSIKPVIQGRIGVNVGRSTQLSFESGLAKFQGSDLHSSSQSFKSRGYTVNGNLADFGFNIHQYIIPGFKLYAIAGLKGVFSNSSIKNVSDQYVTQNVKNFSVVIPVGAGIELGSVGRGVLKFEWIANTVLNDKLDGMDDINSKYDDVYSTALLVYSLPLSKSSYRNQIQHRESRRSYRSFGMKHGQCPQF